MQTRMFALLLFIEKIDYNFRSAKQNVDWYDNERCS